MTRIDETIEKKLAGAITQGGSVEFEPGEAHQAGVFVEDALSEADVLAAQVEKADEAAIS